MYKIYYRNVKSQNLKQLQDFKSGCWLLVTDPSSDEINAIAEQFNLDEGHLLDGIDIHEVPRYEREGDQIYVFTRFPVLKKGKISTFPILFVISNDFVLTLSPEEVHFLKEMFKKSTISTTQKTKFLIQSLQFINLEFKKQINTINKQVHSLSGKIETLSNKELIQFVEFERVLNEFLSSLVPTDLIFKQLLFGKSLKLFDQDEDLIEDLALSNTQLIEISKSGLKNIGNIRETNSTILSNNLNKSMKTLTAITVILTIPTIVSSFYGMNVNLPFQNHPLSFDGILVLTALFTIITTIVLTRKKLF